jgi:uncharacterized membrane protein YphA (DoxX/SURF4 family)
LLWSGRGKLHNLPQVTDNFISWGIPFPHLLTPFVSGVEFFGGLFLLLGIPTRISAGALGITMMVAIRSAKWADVDSLKTLLGFEVEHRASRSRFTRLPARLEREWLVTLPELSRQHSGLAGHYR